MCIDEVEHARLTWVHPGCLEPLGPLGRRREAITVDMTVGRGNRVPTIHIEDNMTGIKDVGNSFVLDARWNMRFDKRTYECTGHCFCWCHSVMTEPSCFASILRFAASLRVRGTGRVCCEHAKHRSVAAANILKLLFEVNVDYSHAARDRTRFCCGERAADNVARMLHALRELPRISGNASRPLATILGLPE